MKKTKHVLDTLPAETIENDAVFDRFGAVFDRFGAETIENSAETIENGAVFDRFRRDPRRPDLNYR